MNKCVKIILQMQLKEGILQDFIQKNAKKNKIEGTAQIIDKFNVKIIACGKSEHVDKFIDSIYQGYKEFKATILEVEPFLKEKDYRGVFRLIE